MDHFSIRSSRVILDDNVVAASITIRDGSIIAIDRDDRRVGTPKPSSNEVHGHDFGDRMILPGLVDVHVHFNQPGRESWEGMATGSAGGRAGGFTTLVDMPLNSSPITTTPETLATKQLLASELATTEMFFHAGVTPDSAESIGDVLDAGAVAAKAFLCDSGIDEFPAAGNKDLRTAMQALAIRNKPLLVHAERTHSTPPMRDARRYADYLGTRPPRFERDAIDEMIRLGEETDCHIHLVHIADGGCLDAIADAKRRGVRVTAETCPHYLTFDATMINDGETQFKCAPPIRHATDREALWDALADGTIDMINSDHSPCPPSMKTGDFDTSWGGIASLQWSLPIIWPQATRRGHSMVDVARWMSKRPSELIGIQRGLTVGCPANVTVFDPDKTWQCDVRQWKHRHPVSPYDGMMVRGEIVKTYLAGMPDR